MTGFAQEIQSIKQKYGIIGNSGSLNHAIQVAVQVAPTDMSVLITGESGSGKESFSKIIHSLSARKHGKFIAINCGAIPEGTIDSELFGHEKGSFTGAYEARKGYFEETDGGTIFLDEVGELSPDIQVKLLRVLQDGEVLPLGSRKPVRLDVRFIAATNHFLATLHPDLHANWKWTAMTLNPYDESNRHEEMVDDDAFIDTTIDHWYFGSDGSGNVMHAENLTALANHVQSELGGKVHLVTADGSIDCKNNPNEQERMTSHLHFCEVVHALTNLALASLGVRWWVYLTGTLIGMLPRTAAVVYAASTLQQLTLKEVGDWRWIALSVGLSIAVMIALYYIAKRTLAKITADAGV